MNAKEITWEDYNEINKNTICMVPIGSFEPHGPHLPLGTDTFISTGFIDLLEEKINIIKYPAISFGVKSHPIRGGGDFNSELYISGQTFMSVIFEIIHSLTKNGFKNIFFLNSHIENSSFIQDAIYEYLSKNLTKSLRIMSASWWNFITETSRNDIAKEYSISRENDNHAALVESSLIAYFKSNLVKPHKYMKDKSERRVSYVIMPTPKELKTTYGVFFDSRKTSFELGKRVVNEVIENMIAAINIEFNYHDL